MRLARPIRSNPWHCRIELKWFAQATIKLNQCLGKIETTSVQTRIGDRSTVKEVPIVISTQKQMTLEEYITYNDGTDTRYELRDGVLVAMGAESDANVSIAMFLY